MKTYVLTFCVVSVAIGVTFFLQKIPSKPPVLSSSRDTSSFAKVEHSSHLFDPIFFAQAYKKGEKYKKVASQRVFGGIVPHHLLAAPLIAGFFDGIAYQDVATIILLSPNHYGVGPHNMATSQGTWTTLFGKLEPDIAKISQLEADQIAWTSEDLFKTEHGIYSITPFIKKTFPQAKIIPIAIKGSTPKEECDMLVDWLHAVFDKQTIVIVSSDFSHYLPSRVADIYDKESLGAIASFNTQKIFTLDHIKNSDSPESLYILLRFMQLEKATKQTLLEHTNSAKLSNQPDLSETTSYFTIYFSKDE